MPVFDGVVVAASPEIGSCLAVSRGGRRRLATTCLLGRCQKLGRRSGAFGAGPPERTPGLEASQEIPKPKFKKKAFPRESRNQHAGGFNQADIPAAIAEEIVVFALVAPEVVAPHPMNLAVLENAVGHGVPLEPEPDSDSEVEEDEVAPNLIFQV
ncbi:unnamed protein product [Cuscuta campestris]|uniref:Uncharacterized protein n=1 Tax=Cuscuta campestris TaxID=132261 RepID=A0A484NC49_9ASTE|nr:unnamed protein product [Cuscuta campestris]